MKRTIQKYLLVSVLASILVGLPLVYGWMQWQKLSVLRRIEQSLVRQAGIDSGTASLVGHILGEYQGDAPGMLVWLLNEEGRPIWRHGNLPFPFGPQAIRLPSAPGEKTTIDAPARRYHFYIHRLETQPPVFLAVATPKRSRGIPVMYFLAAALVALSGACSVGTLLLFMRRRARIAGEVLTKLQDGQLGARLPVSALDELGQFTLQFNRMAAEIESLVSRLKRSESSRVQILEELAHDLRTPLTSILTLFESIADAREASTDYYRECIAAALPEIEYVNRLIADLFLLARMNEPEYRTAPAPTDLRELLDAEVRALSSSVQPSGREIEYRVDASGLHSSIVQGDPHLLRRLFKNLLNNARRFATSSVSVSLRTVPRGGWEVVFRDDGPGFDAKTLTSFGEVRPILSPDAATKDSLGLGSIIVHSIVRLHGGSLRAFNWTGPDGKTGGAVVQLTFPPSAAAATSVQAPVAKLPV